MQLCRCKYDGQRYGVDCAESYFEEAKEEFEKVQKQDKLIMQLRNTGDFTAFYRNSHAMDVSRAVNPVSMFRKGGNTRTTRRYHR